MFDMESFWPEYRKLVPKNTLPDENDKQANKMRVEVIEHSLYLTKLVVGKMRKNMPDHVSKDDLESLASIGLLQAVLRYDHERGVPFEAFANQRMRSVIMDGIREADWATRSLRKKQRDIKQAEQKFRQDQGREPTQAEIADNLGVSTDEVFETKYKASIASHAYIEANPEAQNKSFVMDDEDSAIVDLTKQTLATGLSNLPIKQAAIIALHYYEEKKLSTIAKLLHMSEVKVGTLHKEAILTLWGNLLETLRAEENV